MGTAQEAVNKLRGLDGSQLKPSELAAIAHELARLVNEQDNAYADIDLSRECEQADELAIALDEPTPVDITAIKIEGAFMHFDELRLEDARRVA